MMPFLLGDRSAPVYIKLPSTAEKNMGTRPMVGKVNPVITPYGSISPTPRGKVRIVIARSCRNDSPDRRELSECCILRPKGQILLDRNQQGDQINPTEPLEEIFDLYRETVAVRSKELSEG